MYIGSYIRVHVENSERTGLEGQWEGQEMEYERRGEAGSLNWIEMMRAMNVCLKSQFCQQQQHRRRDMAL